MKRILKPYYLQAVERTQKLILEDVDRYLEKKEIMPSYDQYILDREKYISQIWLNTWINTAASHASSEEKRKYLEENGFSVEGVPKKKFNQLFRAQIREVKPYDFQKWLSGFISDEPCSWSQLYKNAREGYLERKEQMEQRERQKRLERKFEYYIEKQIGKQYEDIYLYIRYLVGSHLAVEIERYGIILSSSKLTFGEYLDNEMEMPYNKFHFVEDRNDAYESLIRDYLVDFLPNWLKKELPSYLLDEYKQAYARVMPNSYLQQIGIDLFIDTAMDLMSDMFEEQVEDLVKLIDIPFDIEIHREIYEKDLDRREQQAFEDREERRKRKEEEQRMIDDIFGREYYPPASRNIHYILHTGETNTGKTFQALTRMKKANSGLYLAPLRLLALEVFEKLNEEHVPCSLKTGEEEKMVMGAMHQSSTVEMFHEKDFYEVIVIDEAQMIADKDRGFAWYRAITKANAKEVHIICSLHAKEMILQLLGNSHVEVHQYKRDIPLEVEAQAFHLNHTRKGDALVCFSRRGVLETAAELQKTGRQVSMIYGSMPPETRKKQMERFIIGETSVIVSTDAIGMGLNLPIRRIVFLENDKFDGVQRRILTSQEVKQIAGRAGRRGIYNIGKVAFASEQRKMKQLLEKEDENIEGFTIAPTQAVLERFQKYSNRLGLFFYLWDHFKSPEGTKKASLSEEKLLYENISGTMIEARLSLYDLFSFLRLPFSTSEPTLRGQWKRNMEAIVENQELPDPNVKGTSLEELELAYKAIGLHLLFLYKLEKRTEAYYWERMREEISDKIHDLLKSGIKSRKRTCRICGKELPAMFRYSLCNECYFTK